MPKRPSRKDRKAPDSSGRRDAIVSDSEESRGRQAREGSPGEMLESRDRNLSDEAIGRDAMDDNVQLADDDSLPADAVDEMAALPNPEDYETTPEGDRRAANDDAEMGLGGEAHSADELADRALGDALRTRRGTTRDGEVHGEDLGLV